MLLNASIDAAPVDAASVSAVAPLTVAPAPDADFEARWTAWHARGLAHHRAARRRLTLVAGAAGGTATLVAIAYALWRP